MKKIILLFYLFEASAHSTPLRQPLESTAAESVEQAPLYLEVGEQRSLSFPHLLRFSVSGESIRHTRIQRQILIKAVKPGISQLQVLEGASLATGVPSVRLIRVERKKTLTRSGELLQALSNLRTLEIIDAGKNFVIRGVVRSNREGQVLAELRDRFADQITDETELAPEWVGSQKPALLKILADYPRVELESLESGLSLHGTVATADAEKNLQRRVRAILPLTHFDIQTLRDQNATLYFKVYLLEMKRQAMHSFGIKWPTEHPMSLQVASFDSGWSLGGPTRIDLSIQAMTQKGQARILSSPELVVRCPGQAELFAGGELPIRQLSKFTDTVTWKSVGLALRLDVKEYSGEKVRLNIETELSHRDDTLANDKIPGIKSNRIKTQVDATMGRPLFLSGLLQDDWRKSFTGVFALADIPILGTLFKSEDFQNERSELVAILVPSREPPAEPIARVASGLPRGFLPLPRRPVDSARLDELRSDSNYPWNALE
ncbi:MAG: type II and III secretion system protein [Bdellovibrionales bacterium]|nr:type II and III secretion system protein [Bdellovibrionales bacterium]